MECFTLRMNSGSACGDGPYVNKGKVKSFLPKPSSYGFNYNKAAAAAEGGGAKLTKSVVEPTQKLLTNGSSSQTTNGDKSSEYDTSSFWTSKVGCRVCLSGVKCGTLMYYGETGFAQGLWCGIKLDEPVGKNNGTVDGVTYFSCPENFGIFAPPSKVKILQEVKQRIPPRDAVQETETKKRVIASEGVDVPSVSNFSNSSLELKSLKALDKSSEGFKKPLASKLLPPKVFAGKVGTLDHKVTTAESVEETNKFVKSSNALNLTVDLSEPLVFNGVNNKNRVLRTRSKFTCEASSAASQRCESERVILNESYVVKNSSKAVSSVNQFEQGDNINTFGANFHQAADDPRALNVTLLEENDDDECSDALDATFLQGNGDKCSGTLNATFLQGNRDKHLGALNATFLQENRDKRLGALNATYLYEQANKASTFLHKSIDDGNKASSALNETYLPKQFNETSDSLDVTYLQEENVASFSDANVTFVAKSGETFSNGCSNIPDAEDNDYASTTLVNNTFTNAYAETLASDLPSSSKLLSESDFTDILAENAPDYEYDDYEGFGRQGSFDLDDSLGILTPNQIRDFTICNENLFKTPSVEDVQELKDEVIDDIVADTNSYQFDDECGEISKVKSQKFGCAATSTPVRSLELKCITDIPSAVCDKNVSFLHMSQFQTPKVSRFGYDSFDLSLIGEVEEVNERNFNDSKHQLATVLENSSFDMNSRKGSLSPILKKDGPLRRNYNFDITEQSIVFAKPLDNLIPPSFVSKYEKSLGDLEEQMATDLAHKLVENVMTDSMKEVVAATSMMQVKMKHKLQIKEDEEVTEYLMQKMGPNFQDHVVEKRDRPISALTVSVTSIDTGYQGDAECDAPSAATSAINTPIDEQKKLFGDGGLNEAVCILRHAKNDGSDSDFCSDMGTSWTESEMENEEKIRGRSARVIDGKLYYNDGEMDQQHTVDFENQIEAILSKNLQNNDCAVKPETIVQSSFEDSIDMNVTVVAIPPVSSSPIPDKVNGEVNCNMLLEVSPLTVESSGSKQNSVDIADDASNFEVSVESETQLSDKAAAHAESAPKAAAKSEHLKPKTANVSQSRLTMKREASRLSDESKKVAKKDESKKGKMPKKNVVSKIKAMIESSSPVKSPAKEDEKPEVPKKVRTPKKSRWDAVMSKIAAGQAEEKTKCKVKKEVKSRIDTNLSGSKQLPKPGDLSFKLPRTSSRTHAQRSFQRDSTLSSEPGFDHVEAEASLHGSNRSSHSDLSNSLHGNKSHHRSRTSHQATSSKSDRPTSPDRLSNVSTASVASPVSVLSHTSQVSHHLQASNCSLNSIASNGTSPSVHKTKESSKQSSNMSRTVLSEKKSLERKNSAAGITKSHAAAAAVGGSTSARRALIKDHAKSNGSGAQRVSKATVSPRASTSKPLLPRNPPAKEQARLRNAKNQQLPFINKSSPLQPDILNSSSVSTTPRRSPAKEIARLEALCEKHVKEKHHMKSYIEQQNVGFEALTMVIHYMNNELSAFSHPQMLKTMNRLENQLATKITSLENERIEKTELENKLSSTVDSNTEQINKMKEEHTLNVNDLQRLLEEQHVAELQTLKSNFEKEHETQASSHSNEIESLKKQFEEASEENKLVHQNKISEIEKEHALKIEELQNKFQQGMAEANENHSKVKKEIEDRVEGLLAKCETLQQEKRDFEEQIMKDSDYKVQVIALKVSNLEKEVDSLKLVVEMKKKEIHHLRKENVKLKRTEEELHLAEEKISLLSTKAEDLQAQVAIKNSKEKRISSECEVLKDCYVKESQISKRLSMEKEELQWRLQQSMQGSQLYSFLNDSFEGQENSFSVSSLSPLRCHSASSSPMTSSRVKNMDRRSLPLHTREANGRLQRYSISESDFHEGYDSIGAQYRRSGSFSWTSSPRESSKEIGSSLEASSIDATVIRKEIEQFSGCSDIQSDEETSSSMMSDLCKDESESAEPQVDDSSANVELQSVSGDGAADNLKQVPETSEVKQVVEKKVVQVQEDNRVPSLITVNNFSTPELSHEVMAVKNKRLMTPRKRCKNNQSAKKSSHKEQRNKEQAKMEDSLEGILDSTFDVESKVCEELSSSTDTVQVQSNKLQESEHLLQCDEVESRVDPSTEEVKNPESQKLEDSFEKVFTDKTVLQESIEGIIDLDYTAMHLEDANESQAKSMKTSMESNASAGDSSAFEVLASLKNPDSSDGFEWLSSSHPTYLEKDNVTPASVENESVEVLNITRTLNRRSRSPTSNSPTSLPSEHSELVNSSQSSTSQSETSSPRASPVFRTRSSLESSDGPQRIFTMSPRTSAGEAMIAELPNNHRQLQDSASLLLRRTFHDQFISENGVNSPLRASLDSGGRDSSEEEASQMCVSKPATPESSSQAVGPTDSTNIDLSWSDEEEDGIPFESEV